MNLSLNDLQYLSKQTKLSPERVYTLVGDDEETLLSVLNSICSREISNEIFTQISFELFSRLATLQASIHKEYTLLEKAFISDSIPAFIHVQNLAPISLANHYPNINTTRYCIILLGFFRDIFKKRQMPSANLYFNIARSGLVSSDKDEIAEHLNDWIEILENMNKRYGFSRQVLKRVEIQSKMPIIKEK